MNPLTQKKHCSNSNQLAYQDNPFNNSDFKNVPKAVLRHNFVSFLTFREQSLILTRISTFFGELANFAREEQDWRDHTVDAMDICMDDTHLYFNKYLKWQLLKKSNNVISANTPDPFIDIIQKKIGFITRLVNVDYNNKRDHVWMGTFSSALTENKQTRIKKISVIALHHQFHKSDFFFELLSKSCPELENLSISFSSNNSTFFTPSIYLDKDCNGLSQLLLKCEHVKLDIYKLSEKLDLTYLFNSVKMCVSLDQNFKTPLQTLFLENLNLDDNWCPVLERCPELKILNLTCYSSKIVKISENFVHSLSQCTQLISLRMGDYIFESNSKENEAALLHDKAFADVFQNCRQLTHFVNQSHLPFGDTIFHSIISHPSLKVLKLVISPSPQILEYTATCNSLKEFSLLIIENKYVNNYIEINSKFSINANTLLLAAAKFFPNLTNFSLYNYSRHPIQINDQAIITFSSLLKLKKVDFGFINQPFSSSCIEALSNCENLDHLEFQISNLYSIEDSPLKHKFTLSKSSSGQTFRYICIPK